MYFALIPSGGQSTCALSGAKKTKPLHPKCTRKLKYVAAFLGENQKKKIVFMPMNKCIIK